MLSFGHTILFSLFYNLPKVCISSHFPKGSPMKKMKEFFYFSCLFVDAQVSSISSCGGDGGRLVLAIRHPIAGIRKPSVTVTV